MSIELLMPSNHLVLSPSIFPSIRVFSDEWVLCIRWPEYWSFSFSISPSSEYSRLISFKMDWLNLLSSPRDSQETSPAPQFKSINSLAFSFLYGPTLHFRAWLLEKIITLTRQTFVSKAMSLLFNTLSRFEMVFFPRGKSFYISWLQLLSAVILESKKIKSVTVSTFSPSICHEVMGLVAMILVFWMLTFTPAFSTVDVRRDLKTT